MAGIYIHIPFCKRKCLYCDFTSFAGKDNLQDCYIKSLKKEILNWKSKKNGFLNQKNEKFENVITPITQFRSIFIGGGTPSYIDSEKIAEVIQEVYKVLELPKIEIQKSNKVLELPKIEIQKSNKDLELPKREIQKSNKDLELSKREIQEITIEVNPGTVNKKKLEDYKNSGINRISIGLQSTKNRILKEIGRIHSFEDFLETYKMARNMGFKNINVDLMIGLPNQSIQDIKKSLQDLIKLEPKPEHISVYSLIVEDNTPMERLISEKSLLLPDEEQERNMYWYAKNFLEVNGYRHYEISNFAKPGFESIHNLDCWEQGEYIGFGVAAHSYINGKRFCNTSNIYKYIENIEKGKFKKNIILNEVQDRKIQMKEYMMLGLRKINGVSIKRFKEIFNKNPIMLYRNEFDKLVKEGLLIIDGDIIKISNKGLDLANLVWEEFI